MAKMKLSSPMYKLEVVLSFLSTGQRSEGVLNFGQIYSYIENQKLNISTSKLHLILNKLAKDELIIITELGPHTVYNISFEGLIFHQQGGYSQKLFNDTLLKRQEESNRRTQRILFWFTGIVAFGTLIAAFYYSVELWKFFHGK